MSLTRKRRITLLTLLFLFATGIRLAVVIAAHDADPRLAVSEDTHTYLEPAAALVEHGEFNRSSTSSTPEFVRTPGYPALVAVVYAVFGESDLSVLLVQVVLGGLSVLITVLLAERLIGSFRLALVAGVLVAVDPVQISASALLLTEALATLLTVLLAYAGVRLVESGYTTRRAILYAVALVAVTYVRPTTLYFALVPTAILIWLAFRRRSSPGLFLRATVAFVVPVVVLLGAWDVRNKASVGSWRFSGIEAVNLYWFRAAGVIAHREGISLDQACVRLTKSLNRGTGVVFDPRAFSTGQLPPVWESRQGEYYGRAGRRALDILSHDPVSVASEFAAGLYPELVQSGWRHAFESFGIADLPKPLDVSGLLVVWCFEILAAIGGLTALKRRTPLRTAHVLTLGLVTYVLFASAGREATHEGFRFRMPIWPILMVYAVIGAREIARLARRLPRTGTDTRTRALDRA